MQEDARINILRRMIQGDLFSGDSDNYIKLAQEQVRPQRLEWHDAALKHECMEVKESHGRNQPVEESLALV